MINFCDALQACYDAKDSHEFNIALDMRVDSYSCDYFDSIRDYCMNVAAQDYLNKESRLYKILNNDKQAILARIEQEYETNCENENIFDFVSDTLTRLFCERVA